MSRKVLILHPKSRGFSALRHQSLCRLFSNTNIEHKSIELQPDQRYNDQTQALIYAQSKASDAVITIGPYLPAIFTPFVHPQAPLWLDWPSDPLADGHARRFAAREDTESLSQNATFSILESVHLGLKRADKVGVISERARWSLLGQLLVMQTPINNPNERIAVTPVCFDFPTKPLIAREHKKNEPLNIALCGSYNSWLWDTEMMNGLDLFLKTSPQSTVLLMGGSAQEHYDAGWIRAQQWSERTPQARIVGWCSEDQFEDLLSICDVGIWLDRPGIEPLLGSRTRALLFAWTGLQIIGTPSCELTESLERNDTMLAAYTASDLQAALIAIQSKENTKLVQEQRYLKLSSYAPEHIFKPLLKWLEHPQRLPSLLPKQMHEQSDIIQKLSQELKKIHTSPTWKIGSKLHRILRRISNI
ncbi:MAG: hypothetical protein CMK59_05640 [Proteobacteria bacterium]|nr:hypothetical protein [Pseudomonadota bacterium]